MCIYRIYGTEPIRCIITKVQQPCTQQWVKTFTDAGEEQFYDIDTD